MFTRRFTSLPTLSVILAVSGIVIVDDPPKASPREAPFGEVIIVGETEDGEFNTVTKLRKAGDQAAKFGLFGFTYGKTKFKYACAKKSGGTELWNGNLYVQAAKLIFGGGVAITRVDTSIGEVTITPRAYVQGTVKPTFSIAHAQTIIFTPNGGSAVTATWSAVAATHTATSGTYNSFTGGETLVIAIDAGPAVTVTFQASDTTLSAIISRINTAFGVTIASNASSQLKLTSPTKGTSSKVIITAGAAATTLGLTAATYSGSGDAADTTVVTLAELKTKLEAASALVAVTEASTGYWRLVSKLGGSGAIAIGNGTANTALGLTNGTSATAALAADTVIPAGTRCSDGGADSSRVVTMQTVTVEKDSTDSTNIKVRPAVDDGTYPGASSSAIDTLEDQPGGVEWSVTNLSSLSDALTADELDSRYIDAIDATIGVGDDVKKRANGIVSARQSTAIRAALSENATTRSASGHYGCLAFVCPPNGTDADTILGASAPGVAVGRAERRVYCVGGVKKKLQELIDGGYASDGLVTQHPDIMAAARWSSLEPGLNFGQVPEEATLRWNTAIFTELEDEAKTWDVDTYAAFKAAGVCATTFDSSVGITFEQAVTSVDPETDPERVDVSRITLADNIGDSLSGAAKVEVKRQGTPRRKQRIKDLIEQLLAGKTNTVAAFDVSMTDIADNVTEYEVSVNKIGSMDAIVFNLSVGANAVELRRAS